MTSDRCNEICAEWLDGWRAKLVADHATPAVLIGVGRDHASGKMIICVPDDLSTADLRTMLIGLYRQLGNRP